MKDWLIQIAIKAGLDKAGPSAVRGAILGIMGWLAMKNNMIPGIQTDPIAHVTIIAWDQVQAWAIAGIPAVAAALIKLFQVHGSTAISAVTEPKTTEEPK